MNYIILEVQETSLHPIDTHKLAEAVVAVYQDYIDYNWNPSDIWEFMKSGQCKDYSDEVLDELNIDHDIDSKIENRWECINEKEFNNILISLYDKQ